MKSKKMVIAILMSVAQQITAAMLRKKQRSEEKNTMIVTEVDMDM